jgi:hypothetical protein
MVPTDFARSALGLIAWNVLEALCMKQLLTDFERGVVLRDFKKWAT